MFLLFLIIVLSFCATFANELCQPIKAILKRPNKEEQKILDEVVDLKCQLSKISIRDDYTQYVKTERKIVSLEKQISTLRAQNMGKDLLLNYGIGYGSQAFLSLVLVFISILYRYEPVIIFDKKFSFAPFGSIINFPTGIEGAISAPFWIFVSSFTFRSIAGILK